MGLKPLVYSKKEAEGPGNSGIGWYRDGKDIYYFQNTIKKKGGGNHYTLTFTVTFKHDDDEIYFAHCYPTPTLTVASCYRDFVHLNPRIELGRP